MRPGRPGTISGVMGGFAGVFAVGALAMGQIVFGVVCVVAAIGLIGWEAFLNRTRR